MTSPLAAALCAVVKIVASSNLSAPIFRLGPCERLALQKLVAWINDIAWILVSSTDTARCQCLQCQHNFKISGATHV